MLYEETILDFSAFWYSYKNFLPSDAFILGHYSNHFQFCIQEVKTMLIWVEVRCHQVRVYVLGHHLSVLWNSIQFSIKFQWNWAESKSSSIHFRINPSGSISSQITNNQPNMLIPSHCIHQLMHYALDHELLLSFSILFSSGVKCCQWFASWCKTSVCTFMMASLDLRLWERILYFRKLCHSLNILFYL